MPLSAAFTIESAANPAEHSVAYGATVDLAITSLAYNTISWSIAGTSDPSQSAPTITLGGTPNGSTASFPMPSDPGDGLGRSFRVKCVVTDASGNTATQYGIVGALNAAGLLPIPVGEEVGERHATHGWTRPVNVALAGVSGGSGVGGSSNTTRVWEVGQASHQYPTVAAALTAINAASPALSATNRGVMLVYPGKYTSTTTYTIPSWLTVRGFGRGATQFQNDTTDLFTVGGDNVWFENFLVEGSPTVGLYAFNCNNASAVHLNWVDMFDNGGTARQFFLKQEGATWTILKVEHCDVDYNGLTGYAWRIYNTSGSARIVDCWIKDCFSDAFALTSGGGNFDTSKLRDIRFWHNVIRGNNDESPPGTKVHTGIRVRNGSSTGITTEVFGCTMTGAERGSGGVAIFGDANTTVFLDNSVARGAASSGTLTTNNSLITA